MYALDQAEGQTEQRAQPPFPPRHLADVGLVIVSGKVKKAVKEQNLDLKRHGMTMLGSLAARRRHADGQIAGDLLTPAEPGIGWKGKDIGRLVDLAETAVEPAQGRIGGEKNRDPAGKPYMGLRLAEKAGQSARRRQPAGTSRARIPRRTPQERRRPRCRLGLHLAGRKYIGIQIRVEEN